MAEFLLWFFMKREKDLKRNFKNSGKIKRIFCTRNVFKPREQKQKTKESFPTFHDKKHSCFGIHQKGEKRETEFKRRIKKRRVIKTRNYFSRHRKRPNMEKHVKKNPREKETEKTKFF